MRKEGKNKPDGDKVAVAEGKGHAEALTEDLRVFDRLGDALDLLNELDVHDVLVKLASVVEIPDKVEDGLCGRREDGRRLDAVDAALGGLSRGQSPEGASVVLGHVLPALVGEREQAGHCGPTKQKRRRRFVTVSVVSLCASSEKGPEREEGARGRKEGHAPLSKEVFVRAT